MDQEIWKKAIWFNEKIKQWTDFDKKYYVSNHGRVKSIIRAKEHILIQNNRTRYYDYLCVKLNGHTVSVHKLIAFAFPEICGEYFEGAQVNHKDENPLNNCAENLEWCTPSYNVHYGHRTEKTSHKIKQIKDGVLINVFKSVREAERKTGIYHSSISNCCKKKPHYNSAGGFSWEFA